MISPRLGQSSGQYTWSWASGRATPRTFGNPEHEFFLTCRAVHPGAIRSDNERWRWLMPRVLVVEDERKVLRSIQRGLQGEGYDVVTAANGEDGYRQATTQPFDCLVLDLMLPGRDGLQI